jgi:cellulose synthase/poly-beta-1,6-N-acetylglucosamine synthase-like glycosyltransferase
MFCPALLTRVPTVVQEYVNKQSREWGRGEMDMLYVYALKSRSALFVYIASRCVCFAACVLEGCPSSCERQEGEG